jgi:HK97 family phage portal protein
MGKVRDFFLGKQPEQRAMTWWARDWESPFGPTAGQPVTQTSVLGLSAAWSAVSLLADSIATLPVDALIEEGDQRVPLPNEARPRWLDKPGNGLSRIDALNQVMMSLLLKGEALILTPRSQGQVVGLTILDPDVVVLHPSGRYSAVAQDIEPEEIIHIRGLMLPSAEPVDQRGLSVLKHAKESLSSGLATQKFGEAFFGNGAWVGTTIEVPGPLSDDGQKAIVAYMNERHRGSSRAHKIGVLTEGAKLSRPLTFSPEDSQFLGTREFQVSDIARFFRVPPEMIGGKSTDALTYSTLEGRSTHFVKFSLLPWIVRIEHSLTQLWRSEDGPENGVIKLNVDGLLRGSTKERYESYQLGIESGFLTVNEVRALEDMPPLPEPVEKPVEEEEEEGDED